MLCSGDSPRLEEIAEVESAPERQADDLGDVLRHWRGRTRDRCVDDLAERDLCGRDQIPCRGAFGIQRGEPRLDCLQAQDGVAAGKYAQLSKGGLVAAAEIDSGQHAEQLAQRPFGIQLTRREPPAESAQLSLAALIASSGCVESVLPEGAGPLQRRGIEVGEVMAEPVDHLRPGGSGRMMVEPSEEGFLVQFEVSCEIAVREMNSDLELAEDGVVTGIVGIDPFDGQPILGFQQTPESRVDAAE